MVLIFNIDSEAIFIPMASASFSNISDFDVYLASNITIGTIPKRDVRQTIDNLADMENAIAIPITSVEMA